MGEADSSRLSMTNPADHDSGEYKPSARPSRKRPLTDRDGVSLRQECRDLGEFGDRPISWNGAISEYRRYIREKRGVVNVFENLEGEQVTGSDPHRFASGYSDKQYAKLKDLERGTQRDFGKRLHTAMLTFTASSTPEGQPLPPVDHLDELLASWSAVTRELRRVLEDRRSARLAILEPHPGDGDNNGYLHIHIAVFVDGPISPEAFRPVIDAHVRNCEHANAEAHTVDDIDVRHAGADRNDCDDQLDELAIYLAEYLGTYGDDDPLEEPEHVQAANAVLWATNRQRWRPCSTAQEYMAYDPPDKVTDWEMVGIEKDGEFYECSGEGGGVDLFTTGPWEPPD